MPAWGGPSLQLASNPSPVKQGGRDAAEMQGHSRREEGARGGAKEPPPPPPPPPPLRSAVPGAPAHAPFGAPGGRGGADVIHGPSPPIPPARGGGRTGYAGRTHGLTQTEGRRDGRTARPCPGRRPARSCCHQKQEGPGPAQVRPRALRRVRLPRPSVRPCPLSVPVSSPFSRRPDFQRT